MKKVSLDRYEYSVLELCANLHASRTGSGDIIFGEELALKLATLMQRVVDWRPSQLNTKEYDDAVRNLILATLRENLLKHA